MNSLFSNELELDTSHEAAREMQTEEGRRMPAVWLVAPSRPRVSVVIPTLNEAKNLPLILKEIPPRVDEVVLVDGNSTDGTVEVARQVWPNNHIVAVERRRGGTRPAPLAQERRREGMTLRLVTQQGRGKGNALQAGVQAATGDIVVTIDADGSNDPKEITHFVRALEEGSDVAKGSRFLRGGGTLDMPWYRKLGNWSFVMLVRTLFGGSYTDLCYGFNAFWKQALKRIDLDADGFEIETLINVQALAAGLRITEVPSFEYNRVYGSSHLRTFPDGYRVLRTILTERVSLWLANEPRGTLAPDRASPSFGGPARAESHEETQHSFESQASC